MERSNGKQQIPVRHVNDGSAGAGHAGAQVIEVVSCRPWRALYTQHRWLV